MKLKLLLLPALVASWSLDPAKDASLDPHKDSNLPTRDPEHEKQVVAMDGPDEKHVSAEACNYGTADPFANMCDTGCDHNNHGSCDANCNDSCNQGCDGSCDYYGASCDHSCDNWCDHGCDNACNSDPRSSCDDSCDSGCTPNSMSVSVPLDLDCGLGEWNLAKANKVYAKQDVTREKTVAALTTDASTMSHVQHRVKMFDYKPGDDVPEGLKFHNNETRVQAMGSCSIAATLYVDGTVTITGYRSPLKAAMNFPVDTGVIIEASCSHEFTISKTLEKLIYSSGGYKVESAFGFEATFTAGMTGEIKPYVTGTISASVQSGSNPTGSASFNKPKVEMSADGGASASATLTASVVASVGPNFPGIGEVTIASVAANAKITSPSFALSSSGEPSLSGATAQVDVEGSAGVAVQVGGSIGPSVCGQTIGFTYDLPTTIGHSQTIYGPKTIG